MTFVYFDNITTITRRFKESMIFIVILTAGFMRRTKYSTLVIILRNKCINKYLKASPVNRLFRHGTDIDTDLKI